MTTLGTIDSRSSSLSRRLRVHARLSLLPAERGRYTSRDGAWWPRSRSLTHELPALITELDRRGLHIARVNYHEPSWDPAPRRITVAGRLIHLGGHRDVDPQLLSLTGSSGDHGLELLVVPPYTDPVTGCLVMTLAARPGNRDAPVALLAAARRAAGIAGRGVPVARAGPLAAAEDRLADAVWESEGGHLRG
jgi:Family of unknown function (DUF5994)